MERTYSVTFSSASKQMDSDTEKKAEKLIIENSKAENVKIFNGGKVITVDAEVEYFPEIMNYVVNVFRRFDAKSEVSYEFNYNDMD